MIEYAKEEGGMERKEITLRKEKAFQMYIIT